MLNYGLAIASNGDWEVIETYYSPGIKDEYSNIRSQTFTLFVAPYEYIDPILLLDQSHLKYERIRKLALSNRPSTFKQAIMDYFDKK